MITAEQARKNCQGSRIKEELEMLGGRIEEASMDGSQEICVDIGIFDDDYMLEATKIKLRELGYDVSWNRACQWYEIRW